MISEQEFNCGRRRFVEAARLIFALRYFHCRFRFHRNWPNGAELGFRILYPLPLEPRVQELLDQSPAVTTEMTILLGTFAN